MYIPNTDDLTLAYVAGLVDGEGSIVIGCSHRANRLPNHWLQVGITNIDKELIDWLLNTFGGHLSDYSHRPRHCWVWRVMGNEAKQFLQSILPYLRIKKKQAEIAIAFQDHSAQYSLKSNKERVNELLEIREGYRKALRALTLGSPSH
jgi:hypothetical protein